LPAGRRQLRGDDVAGRLAAALPDTVAGATSEWVWVQPQRIVDVLRYLHDDRQLDAAQLSSLCAVDRFDHFEVVYHLQSLDQNHQIVVKARIDEHEAASLPSAYSVYTGALLQEREVYDLMGIRFEGHPDLRRIFLWEGYPGFPLRKDFLQITDHHPGLPHFPYETAGKQER
jgi:NADH-quinone oxidoreductase subunit C